MARPSKSKSESKPDVQLTAEILVERIESAQSVAELEALNTDVYALYGESVPEDIQNLANERYQTLIDLGKDTAVVPQDDPEEWIPMTTEEAAAYDRNRQLIGYNARTGKGLLKKEL